MPKENADPIGNGIPKIEHEIFSVSLKIVRKWKLIIYNQVSLSNDNFYVILKLIVLDQWRKSSYNL